MKKQRIMRGDPEREDRKGLSEEMANEVTPEE